MRPETTVGDLRQGGYRPETVRDEMRRNLIGALSRDERILPGMIGYENSVIPEVENAILSGHHMVFLGERGQGKSRMIRALTSLLDEEVPAGAGREIPRDPPPPACPPCTTR